VLLKGGVASAGDVAGTACVASAGDVAGTACTTKWDGEAFHKPGDEEAPEAEGEGANETPEPEEPTVCRCCASMAPWKL